MSERESNGGQTFVFSFQLNRWRKGPYATQISALAQRDSYSTCLPSVMPGGPGAKRSINAQPPALGTVAQAFVLRVPGWGFFASLRMTALGFHRCHTRWSAATTHVETVLHLRSSADSVFRFPSQRCTPPTCSLSFCDEESDRSGPGTDPPRSCRTNPIPEREWTA